MKNLSVPGHVYRQLEQIAQEAAVNAAAAEETQQEEEANAESL